MKIFSLTRYTLHPFLIGIYSLLFLYSYNIDLFPVTVLLRPLAIVVGLIFAFHLVLTPILKSRYRAGLLISLTFVLVFSFTFPVSWLDTTQMTMNTGLIRACLVYGWFGAWALIACRILTTKKNLESITTFLNTSSLILLIFVALPILGKLTLSNKANLNTDLNIKIEEQKSEEIKNAPHIFYIILDAYGRNDILEDHFEYDNSKWTTHLKDLGFYIAAKSNANYLHTAASIASSLNFDYLSNILPSQDKGSSDQTPLYDAINKNKLSTLLKAQGYTEATFTTGYIATELSDRTLFITHEFGIDEFEREIIRRTWLYHLSQVVSGESDYRAFHFHRKRVMYNISKLSELAAREEPLFTFLHLLSPHPPFVFGKDGQPITAPGLVSWWDGSHLINGNPKKRSDYKKYYLDQLSYLNSLLKNAITETITNSSRPIVIILQSDHGPGAEFDQESAENSNLSERAAILNAIYTNDKTRALFYDDISPINTLRVILNSYFGLELPLLPDRAYFTKWSRPYQYQLIQPESLDIK